MTTTSMSAVPVRRAAVASATPYPWPYQGDLDLEKLAVVACRDSFWRLPGPFSDAADERLTTLAKRLRASGALVLEVTSLPARPGYRGPLQSGASDAMLERQGFATDGFIEAAGTNAFYGSALDDLLRSHHRSDLIIAGWGLEGPVHSTLRAANDRGYECLLVPDASTPLDPELVTASCEMVRFSGGIFGAFAPCNAVLETIDTPIRS